MAASGRRSFGPVALALVAGCSSGRKSPPPVGARAGHAIEAAMAAADRVRAPWRCAAPDTPVVGDEKVTVGGHVWQLTDHSLRATFPSDELTIAVIGDAGGAATRTIAALGKLREQLDAAHTDLTIVLGGMGTTQPELEATLGTLSDKAAFPVVVLAGDLEHEGAQRAAIASLRKRGELVVDARLARFIELPGATIGTIPGAGAQQRLVAGADGCSWRPEDVAALYGVLADKGSLRIAALAEAPRSATPGGPTGELALAPGESQPIDIVLHGAAPATPAREGGRDASRIAVSPGSCDATTRLDAPSSAAAGVVPAHVPTAGLLVVKGSRWRWRTVDALGTGALKR